MSCCELCKEDLFDFFFFDKIFSVMVVPICVLKSSSIYEMKKKAMYITRVKDATHVKRKLLILESQAKSCSTVVARICYSRLEKCIDKMES